jgi:hypothetical protein
LVREWSNRLKNTFTNPKEFIDAGSVPVTKVTGYVATGEKDNCYTTKITLTAHVLSDCKRKT